MQPKLLLPFTERYAAPEMNSIMSFQFLTLEASLLPEHLDRLNSSVHPYSLKLPQSTRLFDMLMDSTLYCLSYLDHNILEAHVCIVTPQGNLFIKNKCNSLMPTEKCILWILSTCLVVGQYLEGSTPLQRELCDTPGCFMLV